MEQNRTIETIGSITKMEHLHVQETGVLENTLVLQTSSPFPGVKNKENAKSILGSFFIILRYRYAPEKINRIIYNLLNVKKLKAYPSYGEIITHDTIFPCIRLKELEAFELSSIQEYLKLCDLKLMAFKPYDSLSRIKIFKSFKLVEITDDLYRDLSEGEKFYIQYKGSLNWKRFDYITKKIKYNLENSEFDAGMGVIYRFSGPQNIIRIYDIDNSLERALNLKRWYLAEIKKDIQISSVYQ